MDRFSVTDDGLYYGTRRLGHRDGLYVDTSELKSLGKKDGVARLVMPHRIDAVFAAGSRVVGAESKRPGDLVTSTRSGRLGRQTTTLLETVDVPVLLMRNWPNVDDPAIADVVVNLVRLECLGVLLLPCPTDDEGVLAFLREYRTFLADGSRAALAAIAWTDRRRVAEPYGQGRFLRNIKGLGTAMKERLYEHFGSTRAVLNATEEELRAAKVPAKVRERIREAMS